VHLPLQLPIPWLKLLTSPAVWAIMVANFCYGVGFFTLLTCMPTYFKQVLPRLQISNQVGAPRSNCSRVTKSVTEWSNTYRFTSRV